MGGQAQLLTFQFETTNLLTFGSQSTSSDFNFDCSFGSISS